jgi:DNA-binding CsgD family transcriptional regulator
MKRREPRREGNHNALIEQARNRIEQMETCMKRARTRVALAERRTELAETRTELAEIRAELARTRAEQAETILQRIIHKETERRASNGVADHARPLEELTIRQREVLQHIVEGHNTKQIADILHLSPKTVEYHRAKLMAVLHVHDIPGLVRLAVRAGLIALEA